MQSLLKHRHLLYEGKYPNNTKPLRGLWISVFPVNSTGSLMQDFLWEMHGFVSVVVDEYTVQLLEMCLAHKELSELIR